MGIYTAIEPVDAKQGRVEIYTDAGDFISFFEGAFSNGITRKRQREKAENRRVSIEFSGQVC